MKTTFYYDYVAYIVLSNVMRMQVLLLDYILICVNKFHNESFLFSFLINNHITVQPNWIIFTLQMMRNINAQLFLN